MHQRKKSITKTEEAKMDDGEVKTLGELIEENKERRAEQRSAKSKCQLRCHLLINILISFYFCPFGFIDLTIDMSYFSKSESNPPWFLSTLLAQKFMQRTWWMFIRPTETQRKIFQYIQFYD